MRDLYEQMYPLAAEHHRFILYPPAYGSRTNGLEDDGEGLQLANLTWYVNWAREDTRVVGFSPYQCESLSWPPPFGSGRILATRSSKKRRLLPPRAPVRTLTLR